MSNGIGGSSAEKELANIQPWQQRALPIQASERQQRMARARQTMSNLAVDMLVVNAGASLRYFTGLPWGASERMVALLLPQQGNPILVCPEFERGSVMAGLAIEAEIQTWQEHDNPYALVASLMRSSQARHVAIDPQAPFFLTEGLRQSVSSVTLLSASEIIDSARMIKSSNELALIQQAMSMTLDVHQRAARILAPGITTGEVKRFIDQAHRALGADAGSYFCAVQFAQASAYPHGVPGEQSLADGDIVLIDTGCQVDGYHSDITRTYVFGKPTRLQTDVWQLEKRAQQAAFDAVRPGVACEAVDAAARAVLVEAGYGPDYQLPGLPHRTGHGLGLSIHEPAYLVRGDTTPLAPGMCFSNEPMIVLPDQFGIRLEDHFYVTEKGAQWFTQPSPAIDAPFG